MLSKNIYNYKNEIKKLNDENTNKVLKEMNEYENCIKELDKKDNFIDKKKELEKIKKIVKIKNEIMEMRKNKNSYKCKELIQNLEKINLNNENNLIIIQKRISIINKLLT